MGRVGISEALAGPGTYTWAVGMLAQAEAPADGPAPEGACVRAAAAPAAGRGVGGLIGPALHCAQGRGAVGMLAQAEAQTDGPAP